MNDKERQYRGVSDCVKQMLQNEGPKAFFKGFGMCWARVSIRLARIFHAMTVILNDRCLEQLGTHTILSFVAFERLRSLFGIAPM